jgi:hypothetical protein
MRVLILVSALTLGACAHDSHVVHTDDIYSAASVCEARGYTHVARSGADFFCLLPNIDDELEAVPVDAVAP